MWDVEPDSSPQTAQTAAGIVADVAKHTRPGSIILLHTMYASRATSREAIPGVIQTLRHSGYQFVTVSDLLKHGQ